MFCSSAIVKWQKDGTRRKYQMMKMLQNIFLAFVKWQKRKKKKEGSNSELWAATPKTVNILYLEQHERKYNTDTLVQQIYTLIHFV